MEGWMQRWTSWGFLTVTIVIHIAFSVSLQTGMLNWLFYDTQYLVGQGADFFSYYQAGHNVLNGLNCYIIPDPLAVPYLYPYRYLPYFAYSFGTIINLAPPILAYWLWVGALIVFVWLAALRTRSLAKSLNRPDWEGRIAMGMWFVFTPIYIELYLGQVTLFAGILMFFALTSSSFVDGRKTKGGMTVFWTTGALAKLIPFFTIPALLGAGKARTVLAAAIVTVAAILVVPSGLESLRFFLDFNTARSMYIYPYVGSHSLKMLIFYLIGQSTNDFHAITGLLIGIFVVLAAVATLYSRDVWSCVSLLSLTYFFIMTDVWEHHYTFVLPLLVLAWIRGNPEDKVRWIPIVLTIVMSLPMLPIVAFLAGAGPSVQPITWAPVWQILYHSSKVVPSLVFYLWLLLTAFRYPRESSFSRSIVNVFRNAWSGLITGQSPTIGAGILEPSDIASEHDA